MNLLNVIAAKEALKYLSINLPDKEKEIQESELGLPDEPEIEDGYV